MQTPITFENAHCAIRLYLSSTAEVRIEIDMHTHSAEGTIVLETDPWGLLFGVQDTFPYHAHEYIGLLDLFRRKNPADDDLLRADHPQVIIYRQPGDDPLVSVQITDAGALAIIDPGAEDKSADWGETVYS